MTGHLTAETATVYSDLLLPKLQAQYGLVRDGSGNVEILKKFWKLERKVGDVAPPLIVYADLIAAADRRNLETAQMIYDRYLSEFTKVNS